MAVAPHPPNWDTYLIVSLLLSHQANDTIILNVMWDYLICQRVQNPEHSHSDTANESKEMLMSNEKDIAVLNWYNYIPTI